MTHRHVFLLSDLKCRISVTCPLSLSLELARGRHVVHEGAHGAALLHEAHEVFAQDRDELAPLRGARDRLRELRRSGSESARARADGRMRGAAEAGGRDWEEEARLGARLPPRDERLLAYALARLHLQVER